MLLVGKSTISMAIFHSYVKLPEGTPWYLWLSPTPHTAHLPIQACRTSPGSVWETWSSLCARHWRLNAGTGGARIGDVEQCIHGLWIINDY